MAESNRRRLKKVKSEVNDCMADADAIMMEDTAQGRDNALEAASGVSDVDLVGALVSRAATE